MPTIFDRFEFDTNNIIGQGGMGTVIRGVDTLTGVPVAVKRLKDDIVRSNRDIVLRFQREGEALRDLNHPNIVKMLAAGESEGSHYLIMEYVPGGSLREIIDEKGRMSIQRALYIALDLADALTRAHRLSILHRDIKPDNVLLAEDGTPRLTDFGVARIQRTENVTQDGVLVGTMAYLSPESLTGGTIDERHDIWAFGVMLYEMLAGQRPYPQEMVGALVSAITTSHVPDLEAERPELPIALVDLVYRMLEKDPNLRIRSVRMVGAELEAIIHGSDPNIQPIGVFADGDNRFIGNTTTASISSLNNPSTTPNRPRRVRLINFPATSTAFVGREREIAELQALLADPQNHVVSLIGPGGTGKTRLSMAVAESVAERYHDGVIFVPLEAVATPEEIPAKIADALDFPLGAGEIHEQLINYFKDRQMLLVLDNLEHLIDGMAMIAEGLQHTPGITLLATSRERLRLRGETVYEVDSMAVPSAELPLAEFAENPAVKLFMNGAVRNASHFELTDESALSVQRVIQLVQGMPLGIELAAGWLEMLNIEEIANEIETSLDFLETDMRDVPVRHRSMRAVFDYSWNLMSPDEQNAFMKLSIFRDGFERAAAQTILGTSLKTLTSLVNKSLLFRAPNGRYTVHALLRQYAEEKFKDCCPDTDKVKDDYINYYFDFKLKVEKFLYTHKEKESIEAFETEAENMRHAWALATQRERFDDIDKTLEVTMQYYLFVTNTQEASVKFKKLLDQLEKHRPAQERLYWRVKLRYGLLLGRTGEYLQAEKVGQEALVYFRANPDREELLWVLNGLGYAAMMRGHYDESRRYQLEAKAMLIPNDHVKYISQTTGNLGYLEFLVGNYAAARDIYLEMIQERDPEHTSHVQMSFGYNNLGEISQALGNLPEAERYYQAAYDIFSQYKNKRGMAFSGNNLAGVKFLNGHREEAVAMYQRAFRLNREIGDRAGLGHSLSAMGNIAMGMANFQEAQDYYKQALAIRRDIGDDLNVGRNLAEIGLTLYLLGDFKAAYPYFDEAEEIGNRLENAFILWQVYLGRGNAKIYEKQYDEALPYFRKALEFVSEGDHWFALSVIGSGVAVVLAETGQDELAAQLIGYVDSRQDIVRFYTETLLKNLRYALENRLGAGYHRARAVGETFTLEELSAIINGVG